MRDFLEIAGPVFMGVLLMMIPIVALLTHHQRKMAQIFRSRESIEPAPPALESSLLRKIVELRSMVAQQAIAIDSLGRSTQEIAARLPEREKDSSRMDR